MNAYFSKRFVQLMQCATLVGESFAPKLVEARDYPLVERTKCQLQPRRDIMQLELKMKIDKVKLHIIRQSRSYLV